MRNRDLGKHFSTIQIAKVVKYNLNPLLRSLVPDRNPILPALRKLQETR